MEESRGEGVLDRSVVSQKRRHGAGLSPQKFHSSYLERTLAPKIHAALPPPF